MGLLNMPNMSGNFDTYEEEKSAVKHYLSLMGLNPEECNVTKFGGDNEQDTNVMSATDITVKLPDNRTLLIEVKQESYSRFSRWGQLGFDLISVFQFKEGMSFDSKPHYPRDYDRFIATVDINRPGFKWGKLAYSNADIWLFYVKNPNGGYYFCEGYDYAKMKNDRIITYLRRMCQFAVNSKNANQMSHRDTWQSATFFVNPNQVEQYKITPDTFGEINNFTALAT